MKFNIKKSNLIKLTKEDEKKIVESKKIIYTLYDVSVTKCDNKHLVIVYDNINCNEVYKQKTKKLNEVLNYIKRYYKKINFIKFEA